MRIPLVRRRSGFRVGREARTVDVRPEVKKNADVAAGAAIPLQSSPLAFGTNFHD